MKLCSLSSGSRGNCIIVNGGDSTIVVDVGIPLTNIKKALRYFGTQNVKVLITHTHIDHIKYLPAFIKEYGAQVFCHPRAYNIIKRKTMWANITPISGDFYVGSITVSPFEVSHDVPCMGYSFYSMGSKISIATDLGQIGDKELSAISGSALVLLESNHDEDMLLKNPAYPYVLKRRILSERGHLSNISCAKACYALAVSGTKQFVLGHLSAENNTPNLAKEVTCGYLRQCGITDGVFVSVAEYNKPTPIFEVN